MDVSMKKATELLEKLQWSGTADFQLFTTGRCPICGGLPKDVKINEYQTLSAGHEKDCELNTFLLNHNGT